MTSREPQATGRRGGGLDGQPAPRVVGRRVDAFYLAFKGELREDVRAHLEELRARGEALNTEVPVEIGDLRGALSTRSREGWWVVQSAWLTVTINERASHGWQLEIRPSALLLMHEGEFAALTFANDVARGVLELVREARLRRIDLCADLVHLDLAGIDPQAFVTHHKTRIRDIAQFEEFFRAGMRTGFMMGKSDAVSRLYDKTEHLRLGLDETKAEDERAAWKSEGWNGTDDVVRAEFQLRGRILDELDIRDPAKALERLDAIWGYCIKKWLRLVVLGTATRKRRCKTDRRWEALEDVVFRAPGEEPARRVRAPSTPHARRMVSAIVNFCACIGVISAGVGDPRQVVAGWSEARAEQWLQEQLNALARFTVKGATADLLLASDDPREAAARLMEKQSAACMKFARATKRAEDAAIAA